MRLAIAMLTVAVALTAPPAFAESAYPTPTRDGRERIQRTGVCPSGFVGKGPWCEALHANTPHVFPHVLGTACPTGTFRSGDACKAFR